MPMTVRKNPKRKLKPRKKAAPSPEQTTVITMVVDESGSMTALADATISGFNEYVDTVTRELKGARTYFSALKFDTRGIRKLCTGVPISEAVRLSKDNYQPLEMTPLLDAVGAAITATDEVMTQQRGSKAIVVIQTDGYENASVKYKLADIQRLIEEKQGRGWQFVFIGAGINAFGEAQKFGIITANTMSYGADAVSTQQVFRATAANTNLYASGQAVGMNYTVGQSVDAGENPIITAQKMAKTPPPKASEGSSAITTLSLTE